MTNEQRIIKEVQLEIINATDSGAGSDYELRIKQGVLHSWYDRLAALEMMLLLKEKSGA